MSQDNRSADEAVAELAVKTERPEISFIADLDCKTCGRSFTIYSAAEANVGLCETCIDK